MQYCLNYSGIGFCPLKIKMTQFPNGFRLNSEIQNASSIAFCNLFNSKFKSFFLVEAHFSSILRDLKCLCQ